MPGPSSTPRLRVGIVGCGEVTQIVHLPTLAQLVDLFEVTALCDVSPHVLRVVGDAWGVAERTTDAEVLVGLAQVDAVLIANPNAFHADTTLAALAHGKHVLVEKPMAMTLAEADAVIAAAEGSGRVVQVGTMRRYAPAFVEAVRRLPDLGPVRLARVHDVIGQNALIIGQIANVVRGTDVPEAVLAAGRAADERRVVEALGADPPPPVRRAYGLLLGLSSHDTSAMRELLGRPRGVLYAAAHHGGEYLTAAFDYGDFVCHFETGVDAVPRFDAHLEVFTAEAVLRVQYDTPYVRHLPTRLTVRRAVGEAGVADEQTLPTWADPFVEEWRAFAANVRAGRPATSSPADFREDLEHYGALVDLLR